MGLNKGIDSQLYFIKETKPFKKQQILDRNYITGSQEKKKKVISLHC